MVGVSALSTLAMIVYPMLAHALGLDRAPAGIFLGATIHDVAQVVGAGYSMSKETGDVATLVKLMRVAMLLPVIVFAVMLTRARDGDAARRPASARRCCPGSRSPSRCWWRSTAPAGCRGACQARGSEVSRWCLVAAIAGIGMKTQLKELATVGLKPVLLMLGETVFLAALVLGCCAGR